MKLFFTSIVLLAVLCLGAPSLLGKDKPAKEPGAPINTKCPVTGDDADGSLTHEHKGKVIAFCCEGCIEDFQKDPDKYLKIIANEGKKKKPAK